MTARDTEFELLGRCAAAASEASSAARDKREANVFRVAAMVVQSRHPGESRRLMNASERYFAMHPGERLASSQVVTTGWVTSLPRLRDMLSMQFHRH